MAERVQNRKTDAYRQNTIKLRKQSSSNKLQIHKTQPNTDAQNCQYVLPAILQKYYVFPGDTKKKKMNPAKTRLFFNDNNISNI